MNRASLAALALPLAAAFGCQSYNFTPVGHCVVQPGTRRLSLSRVTTADVLFVVDDSDSMTPDQDNLARSFSTFIANLNATNQQRVSRGLAPIDFHIAITTTSIFENFADVGAWTCQSTCTGLSGQYCCDTYSKIPLTIAKECPTGGGCSGGYACSATCAGYGGIPVCCGPDGKTVETAPVACTTAGARCGDWKVQFVRDPPGCVMGLGTPGGPYAHGGFVGAPGNPRVLHFEKSLYETGNAAAIQQLATQFTQNVHVGSCGSGEEQGLQAARLALEKALAGQQLEADGSRAVWPHPGSKLVLVFVGDEDDCSSPEDPALGIVLSGPPGADTCVSNEGNKEWATQDFVSYFTSIRPPGLLGAAFIVATQSGTCEDLSGANACFPGTNPATCGSAAGRRFLAVGGALQAAGAEVVAGPICSSDFGPILNRVAEIVKPPSVLVLPTPPASVGLVELRIVREGGITRRTCAGPAPAGTSVAAATASYDWWFTRTGRPFEDGDDGTPQALTEFVYVNHERGTCEADAGDTYSADYIGRLPEAGCTSDAGCDAAVGPAGAFECCGSLGANGACQPPASGTVGTCLCKK